jgi:hypothetical protein
LLAALGPTKKEMSRVAAVLTHFFFSAARTKLASRRLSLTKTKQSLEGSAIRTIPTTVES